MRESSYESTLQYTIAAGSKWGQSVNSWRWLAKDVVTLLLQKWWGHWIRTCHNGKWCGEKLSTLFLEKLFISGSAHLFVVSYREREWRTGTDFQKKTAKIGLRQSSRVTWLMAFVFALETSCRKPQLLSTFYGFFVERSWFPTVCDWLISGAILFDICSFATMCFQLYRLIN